jgi:hypothetical protein
MFTGKYICKYKPLSIKTVKEVQVKKQKRGVSDVRSEPVTFNLEASHLKPSIINLDSNKQIISRDKQGTKFPS